MVQDRLNRAVMSRLQELGLPQSLIEFDEFRDRFFRDRWVMFVRDRDKIADVHLVEPHPRPKSFRRRSRKS
jgi:hypothetical protein